MCQPGRPLPHGEGQLGSPGFAPFQRAKSSGSSFCSPTAMRAPDFRSSSGWCESLPYSLSFPVRKYTSPFGAG